MKRILSFSIFLQIFTADDEVTHTVTRAKLPIRTYYDEKQDIAAEPIWYFEVTDGEAVEIVLINAINGNEIFLN